MTDKTPEKTVNAVYGEMIFSLLSEFKTEALALLRSINTSMANVLKAVIDLGAAVSLLTINQTDARSKRYREEIESREAMILRLQREIDDKKIDRADAGKKTEDIIKESEKTFRRLADETSKTEQQNSKTIWQKRREVAITALIGTGAVALGWALWQTVILPLLLSIKK